MPETLKIQGPLDPAALRVVRELPDMAAEQAPDAVLEHDGRTFQLEFKYRPRIGAADAWQLASLAEADTRRHLHTVLALAERTTQDARRILAEKGIAYIDATGNAHLDLPGLYVHVERPQPKQEPPGTRGRPRLAGKTGVAAQALL